MALIAWQLLPFWSRAASSGEALRLLVWHGVMMMVWSSRGYQAAQ